MVFELFFSAITIYFTVTAIQEEFNRALKHPSKPEADDREYQSGYGRHDLNPPRAQAQLPLFRFVGDLFARQFASAQNLRSAQHSSFSLRLKNAQRAEPEKKEKNQRA